MRTPLVSVILLEYYSLDEIAQCLRSITYGITGISYEIIVSSNSCYDTEMKDTVLKRFPGINFCFNDKNGGFAYGMNRGMEKARGSYLVIANTDTIVLNGFINLISFMENHPEVGAAGPQMLNSKGVIQDTFRDYLTFPKLLKRQLGRILKGSPVLEKGIDHSLIQTVDWIIGAFLVINRKSYEATKGFDENFFLYAEDLDWCTRIRASGSEIVYYPLMKVQFEGSREARRFNRFTLIFIKSHLRYWFKFGFFSGYPLRRQIVYTYNG